MKVFHILFHSSQRKICIKLLHTWVAGVQLIEAINSTKHEVEDHLTIWIVHA